MAGLAVEPRPYQLVPLLMAMRQDVTRLLISDDVGIGKTVEAGLVAAELLAQGDARGLAVLCSPALAKQWQDELRVKFGIDAELVLPSTVTRLERRLLLGESLFDKHPHVIISTDFIKQPRRRDDFVRACPDLVIADEAHTCITDSTTRGGKGRHLRHELLRQLAKDPQRHLILVTATPHSGKEEGFRNLLGLLDPRLADVDLDQVAGRDLLARHFVQRRRGDIRSYLDEDTPFPSDRQTREEPYTLTPAYRKLVDEVLTYARESVRDADDGTVRQRVRWWSALALLRALASSPRAAAVTLRTRARNADATSTDEADELGRSAVLDLVDDEALEAADASPGADPTGSEKHNDGSRRLLAMAAQAAALEGKPDAKLTTVTKVVQGLLADGYDPIVFCRFIDTAEYVAEHLAAVLKKTAVVEYVTGTLAPPDRVARIADLGDKPGRKVLVATDCLSEGVNLQQLFQAVVHYDLAWNPTRHEQREGRVDRFGQTRDVVRAVTIYGRDNTIDGIVLDVLIRKHDQIRKALGVSVPVPENSDDVMTAVLEGVLLHDHAPEQLTLDIGHLQQDWDSTAEKERQSRTKYAQLGIQPGEVARELAEIRASLGTATEIETFAREALTSLGAAVIPTKTGFTATTHTLPVGLRDAFTPGHREPLPFHRDLPVPRHEACLDRTDPEIGALARYVLDTAVDPSIDARTRPARRCGVMRTAAVTRRTTILLVRYRLHLTLPGRDGDRPLVAEDARAIAFRGSPAKPQWLDETEVATLLAATPAGNVSPEAARDFVTSAITAADDLRDAIDATADTLADDLRAAHLRVRESAGQRVRRRISVTAQKPADVLGVFVYLPPADGGTS
ncbi:helicase-related protein [Nucisporomicrobium flavum]|uniref:helicase-related protein n=1 Tax=Nucisporomicrobium flavum TaxID=2785915 RepID=UPI003C2F5DCE